MEADTTENIKPGPLGSTMQSEAFVTADSSVAAAIPPQQEAVRQVQSHNAKPEAKLQHHTPLLLQADRKSTGVKATASQGALSAEGAPAVVISVSVACLCLTSVHRLFRN